MVMFTSMETIAGNINVNIHKLNELNIIQVLCDATGVKNTLTQTLSEGGQCKISDTSYS